MQVNTDLSILSQLFVVENMPYGGYSIVSNRLKDKIDGITGIKVKDIIRNLKKEPNNAVIAACCTFLKENNVKLNANCEKFLDEVKEKAGDEPGF
jgi:hypothetical protein